MERAQEPTEEVVLKQEKKLQMSSMELDQAEQLEIRKLSKNRLHLPIMRSKVDLIVKHLLGTNLALLRIVILISQRSKLSLLIIQRLVVLTHIEMSKLRLLTRGQIAIHTIETIELNLNVLTQRISDKIGVRQAIIGLDRPTTILQPTLLQVEVAVVVAEVEEQLQVVQQDQEDK